VNSKVAVLLVRPDFLASKFIHEHELGPLLKAAELGGGEILWVPVRASAYKKTALADYQAVLDPAQPLANMTPAERDQAWVKICEQIEKVMSAEGPLVGKAKIFDVFLCHNSEDKPAVRDISRQLVREGINPWLDELDVVAVTIPGKGMHVSG
jgi:hypothetical protein